MSTLFGFESRRVSQFEGLEGEYEAVEPVFEPGADFPILESGQSTVHNGKAYFMAHEVLPKIEGIKGHKAYIMGDDGKYREIPTT